MESCFKIINREYYNLNKAYVKMIKQLKYLLDNKTKKQQKTIIDKLRLIRKSIIDLTYRIEDFNETPTLEDELHMLELQNEDRLIKIIKEINFLT